MLLSYFKMSWEPLTALPDSKKRLEQFTWLLRHLKECVRRWIKQKESSLLLDLIAKCDIDKHRNSMPSSENWIEYFYFYGPSYPIFNGPQCFGSGFKAQQRMIQSAEQISNHLEHYVVQANTNWLIKFIIKDPNHSNNGLSPHCGKGNAAWRPDRSTRSFFP